MANKDWPRSTRPVIMGTRHGVRRSLFGRCRCIPHPRSGRERRGRRCRRGTLHQRDAGGPDQHRRRAPLMMYLADSGTVETISGLGWWPKAATIDFFQREQGGRIRRGVNRCVLPSAIDAWLTAIERHGTMTFADVTAPAIELADDGFPMRRDAGHPVHAECAGGHAPVALDPQRLLTGWPSDPTRRGWCRRTSPTLRLLVEAEGGATNREAGIRAARDVFIPATLPSAWSVLRASRAVG